MGILRTNQTTTPPWVKLPLNSLHHDDAYKVSLITVQPNQIKSVVIITLNYGLVKSSSGIAHHVVHLHIQIGFHNQSVAHMIECSID